MNKLYFLLIIAGFATNISFAQYKQRSPVKTTPLKYVWKLKEANYKNTGETLSTFTLINSANKLLPASGWTIYFNGAEARIADNDTSLLKVKIVNGDFFKIQPGASFKGLEVNKSVEIKLLSRALKNITDGPKGFYIVFDNDLANPLTLTAGPVINEVDYTAREKQLAAKQYQQNAAVTVIPAEQLPPVFPTPISWERNTDVFILTNRTIVAYDQRFSKEGAYLHEELNKISGKKPLSTSTTQKTPGTIKLVYREMKTEAYELSVKKGEIIISSGDNAGIFYGIQSLKSMIPAVAWKTVQQQIVLKGIYIKDEPRFPHRAFMMDIARNFQEKKEILKVIDLLSLYKVNVLHLHLNDDEGWRIEIPGLPELTTVGSKRGHTADESANIIPAYGSGPVVNNNLGSGFLSRSDFIEILAYATRRHINVIPEFETPGHARAAIKSMNARYAKFMREGNVVEANKYLLRDVEDQSVYRSVQGFDDNVLNPAVPSVYTFLEKITDEMLAMYKTAGATLKTVHFGGDEVPAGVWEKSPAVAKLLKQDPSIKNVDEIWYYYFNKVNGILKKRGLYLSGWEEIGLKKELVNGQKKMVVDSRFVKENFHTDVWNNLGGAEDLAYKLANAGYKVVLTNVTNMYMDLSYADSYEEPGQYWGGYVDVDKLFSFIPFNYYKNQKENERGAPMAPGHFKDMVRLTEAGKANIVGLQAPLWSEIITTPERFEYLLLPKLLGLAERSWAKDPSWATDENEAASNAAYQKAWSVFVNVLGTRELPRLDYYAGGFNYRIPAAAAILKDGVVTANTQMPGFTIRYTTDGTEPTSKSKVYSNNIPPSAKLSLRVFNAQGRGGRTISRF